MKTKMYIQVEIRDAETGKVKRRIRKRLCKSYVKGMIDVLRAYMNFTNDTAYDTGNQPRSLGVTTSFSDRRFCVAAIAGSVLYGIVVGTSTTPVAIDQYALLALINHGSGVGQLSYGATSVGIPATVGTSRLFTIARTFTNLSGSDITVEEVGLYIDSCDSAVNPRYFMIERSLLNFIVANTESATVTYTVTVTV